MLRLMSRHLYYDFSVTTLHFAYMYNVTTLSVDVATYVVLRL